MIERLSLDVSKHPNFIGCWMLEDLPICNDLIQFFEKTRIPKSLVSQEVRKSMNQLKCQRILGLRLLI